MKVKTTTTSKITTTFTNRFEWDDYPNQWLEVEIECQSQNIKKLKREKFRRIYISTHRIIDMDGFSDFISEKIARKIKTRILEDFTPTMFPYEQFIKMVEEVFTFIETFCLNKGWKMS